MSRPDLRLIHGTSILDQTSNLITIYEKYCGQSEVPKQFQTWCCLSAIAACVQDRVWVNKDPGGDDRVDPSLYVFLVGPSAVGKGTAMKGVLKFLEGLEGVNVFAGDITAEKLKEHLSGPPPDKDKKRRSKIYLVHGELADSVGGGPMADKFIKTMTRLYGIETQKTEKQTVTGATARIYNPCLNWLAGTTDEWMVEVVPKSAVEGGFISRLIAIRADYQDRRHFRRSRPHNFAEIARHLRMRFENLALLEGGEMTMTEEAAELEENWYMHRPYPSNPKMIPWWKRAHDLVLKLAMLFSLSDSYNLEINKDHMTTAIEFVTAIGKTIPGIIDAASVTKETQGLVDAKKIIKKHGLVKHSILQRKMSVLGYDRRKLQVIVETLIDEKAIHLVKAGRVKGYEWNKQHWEFEDQEGD